MKSHNSYEILPTVAIQNTFIEITHNLSYKETNCFFQRTLVVILTLVMFKNYRLRTILLTLQCFILSLKYTCGTFNVHSSMCSSICCSMYILVEDPKVGADWPLMKGQKQSRRDSSYNYCSKGSGDSL